MSIDDWGDDDGPPWFSPFAWPRWARIAFAVTLPISGPLWVIAFMAGSIIAMGAFFALLVTMGPLCLAIELFKKR